MELVYCVPLKGFNGLPRRDIDNNVMWESGPYGGSDLSVDGQAYKVRKSGSRYLVEVPDHMAPRLYSHGFLPTHIFEAQAVSWAAEAAIQKNRDEKVAQTEREMVAQNKD